MASTARARRPAALMLMTAALIAATAAPAAGSRHRRRRGDQLDRRLNFAVVAAIGIRGERAHLRIDPRRTWGSD